MKTYKTKNTLKLPLDIHESQEIEVDITYHIGNDGIGKYEYWGAICYDHGPDYVEIDDIQPIFTTEDWGTQKHTKEYINENFEDCACELEGKMTPEPPDEKDTDY